MSSFAIFSALALPLAAQAGGKAFEPPKGVKPVLRAGLVAASGRTRALTRTLEKMALPPSVVAQPARLFAELVARAPGSQRSSVLNEGRSIQLPGTEFETYDARMTLKTVTDRGSHEVPLETVRGFGPAGIFEMTQHRHGGERTSLGRALKRVEQPTQLADGTVIPAGSWLVRARRVGPADESSTQLYVIPKGSSARPIRVLKEDADHLMYGR